MFICIIFRRPARFSSAEKNQFIEITSDAILRLRFTTLAVNSGLEWKSIRSSLKT